MTVHDPRLRERSSGPVDPLGLAIEGLVGLLLAFMPAAFGVVHAWSEQVVLVAVALLLVLVMVRSIVVREGLWPWSWSYVPVAGFVGVVVLQTLSLPAGLVRVLSPQTAQIKTELVGEGALSSMPLTFYPQATQHGLCLALGALAMFAVVTGYYTTRARIKRLLASIALIGGVFAVLAVGQVVTRTDKIYWLVTTGHKLADAGPFVNHSNYAQFMNLSLGAALALVLVMIRETTGKRSLAPSEVVDLFSSSLGKRIGMLVAMIIVALASIFTSLSRGGIIGLLVGGGLVAVLLTWRKACEGRGRIMVLLAITAFVCILYIGFDAVYERLATLQDPDQAECGRWQILQDIARAWTQFPLFGTGLGTHPVVYPVFDRSTVSRLAFHAENEYAQAIEETGLIGLCALAAFGAFVWAAFAKLAHHASRSIHAAAFGLGFGLLAILIQSLSDFGQHLPANTFLSVTYCALLLNLARSDETGRADEQRTEDSGPRGIALRLACLCAILLVAAWVAIVADRTRVAAAHWTQAAAIETTLMEAGWEGTDQQYVDLISEASSAAQAAPGNVEFSHWLNVYRWRSLCRNTDPNTGDVMLLPQTVEFVRRIVDELRKTTELCPTYGGTYCLMGELQHGVLNDPQGVAQIRTAYRLAPCDPTVCLVAGYLDAEQNDVNGAFTKLGRAVKLDGRLFGEVARYLVVQLGRPDLAIELAADDLGRLGLVADVMAGVDQEKEKTAEVRAKVVELLKAKCQAPDAPAGALASLANIQQRNKDTQSAIQNYRRALALDYGQVYWRFSLAKLLADEDKVAEAIEEARICLRFQKDYGPALGLIRDLSTRPGGVKTVGQ